MSNRLLLVIALLSHCTVPGLPEDISALEGGDVILPCSFNTTANGDFPDVEWSKEGLDPNVVLLYRGGYETVEMKNLGFEYRTSFIQRELKNGNISLRIASVQLSDAGRYQCMTLWRNARRDVTTVDLFVGTVSEPKLSVVSAACGGLTVQCEANHSLPEPEITFLDDQGNELPAEDPKRDNDGRGNYIARRRVTLHSATNSFRPRITCRVHQPDFNLVRHTNILIPAPVISFYCLLTFITVGWTILLFAITCGLAIWLWKRCGKSATGQTLAEIRQESEESPLCNSIKRSHVQQSDWADIVVNGATDTLQSEVTHLKSELHNRNEIIRHLLNAGVCQNKLPRFVCSDHISTNTDPPQSSNPTAKGSNHRRYSCPASLPLKAPRKKLGRSLSESSAQPHRRLAKLQRRHSSGIQSTNPYTVLGDVTEESEPPMSWEKRTD